MITTTSFRLLITGALLAVITLTSPLAQANCGGCGGGDKKECPSPTPAPSPAK